MANPGYSSYFPIYACADRVPEAFSWRDAKRSPDSAWWFFKSLQQAGDRDYEKFYPLVKDFWTEHLVLVTIRQQQIEENAISLIRNGSKDEAVALLRTFTSNQAQDALSHAQHLLGLVQHSKGKRESELAK
jgi:dipeptidase